jgi:hypothetical protein
MPIELYSDTGDMGDEDSEAADQPEIWPMPEEIRWPNPHS